MSTTTKKHERFRVVTTSHDGKHELHSHHATREEAQARIGSDGLTNNDMPAIERGAEPWDASGTTSTVWLPDPEVD
jgi:hypothetical protein